MIGAKHITNGRAGGNFSSVINTATISLANEPGKLILVTVAQDFDNSNNANQPSISGCNLTWELVRTLQNPAGPSQRISIFRALGANPTTGQLTIDCGGQVQQSIFWSVDAFEEVDRSGSNGNNAVVQSNSNYDDFSNDNTPLTVSLSAFGSTRNATLYAVICPENNSTPSAPSGWVELAKDNQDLGPDNGFLVIFKNAPDTAPATQWSGSGAESATAIALEIKAEVKKFLGMMM